MTVATFALLGVVAATNMCLSTWAMWRMFVWSREALRIQREHMETKRQLAIKIVELEIERAKKSMVVHVPAPARFALDDQTKALVRLALLNPSEHERQSAALIVCKRLKEKIDGDD